jgi:hypothetical protein
MKVRDLWRFASIVALGAALPLSAAYAQKCTSNADCTSGGTCIWAVCQGQACTSDTDCGKPAKCDLSSSTCAASTKVSHYIASLLPIADGANSTPFAIGKVVSGAFVTTDSGSKVVLQTDNKAGDGGLKIQMLLKGVDCAAYSGKDDTGNDKGKPSKCGVKGTSSIPATPVTDHVLELGVNFAGVDVGATSLLYDLTKGVASFEIGGKNKVVAAATPFYSGLGAIPGVQVLGITKVQVHAASWNCDTPGTCTSNADCPAANETCDSLGLCVSSSPTACVQDSDCASLAGTACLTNVEVDGCNGGIGLAQPACLAGGVYGITGTTISAVR